MYFQEYIRRLRHKLAEEPLPGMDAQRRLAPRGRIPDDYHPEPPQSRQAAVLIHLVPDASGSEEAAPCFPVILRPDYDTHHASQIALPGGQREAGENFPVETALREAYEELGIPGEAVEIIGTLTPLFISVSNFSVVPVLGWSAFRPHIIPDPREVAAVYCICADELLLPPASGMFPARGGYINAPYFSCREGSIWGATAMMLCEFVELHRQIIQQLE